MKTKVTIVIINIMVFMLLMYGLARPISTRYYSYRIAAMCLMDIDVMYDEPNRGPLDCMTEWDAFPERYEEYLAEQRIKSMIGLAVAVVLIVIDTIVIARSKKKSDKHDDKSTSN